MARAEDWCVKLGHEWGKKRKDGNRKCRKCGAWAQPVKAGEEPAAERNRRHQTRF